MYINENTVILLSRKVEQKFANTTVDTGLISIFAQQR